jgi:hypothetical protein
MISEIQKAVSMAYGAMALHATVAPRAYMLTLSADQVDPFTLIRGQKRPKTYPEKEEVGPALHTAIFRCLTCALLGWR